MGVNSLPQTVTRQRCDCDLNPGPSAPESSTQTARLPSHPLYILYMQININVCITYNACGFTGNSSRKGSAGLVGQPVVLGNRGITGATGQPMRVRT